MTPADRAEQDRLIAYFASTGAEHVDVQTLLAADTLLDLYGEDIRGRAYLTQDPLRGELVLRPDFTVPVVQQHLHRGGGPARYTYAGPVFRKQDQDTDRPCETLQVGYEVFDAHRSVDADAEVFALVAGALDGLPVTASTGDIGIISAAVAGLSTTQARKDALLRHLWRPNRFKALLDRFGGKTPPPPSRVALLAMPDPLAANQPVLGLRSRSEIAARIEALRADAATPPISRDELAVLDKLLAITSTATAALTQLQAIAANMGAIGDAVDVFAQRLSALSAKGVDVDTLAFEGSYGRTSLEYYDGFVFGFSARADLGLPPLATGGRYDTLARQLSPDGQVAPAVGAVIRPEPVTALKANL